MEMMAFFIFTKRRITMVKETKKLKEIKIKLPPETVETLTFLAGGRNHRAAYIDAFLHCIVDSDAKYYLRIKASWVGRHLNRDSAGLQEIGLKLPTETIALLDRLSGGKYYYSRYLTALVMGAVWMPAFIHALVKPEVSAPRPNFKAENSNLPRRSKSPRVGVG
jgi:hypothetical protein